MFVNHSDTRMYLINISALIGERGTLIGVPRLLIQ